MGKVRSVTTVALAVCRLCGVMLTLDSCMTYRRTRGRHQRVAAAISTQSRRIDAVPQGRPAPPLQHSPSQQPPPQQPQASGSNPQDLSSPSSLSSIDFGRLWEQLPLAGSFECTVSALPDACWCCDCNIVANAAFLCVLCVYYS